MNIYEQPYNSDCSTEFYDEYLARLKFIDVYDEG
jgi:hypothetical protein